jgi:hypothetical protein
MFPPPDSCIQLLPACGFTAATEDIFCPAGGAEQQADNIANATQLQAKSPFAISISTSELRHCSPAVAAGNMACPFCEMEGPNTDQAPRQSARPQRGNRIFSIKASFRTLPHGSHPQLHGSN